MYEGNPAIGLYTLPLIIWYTMQLVIGTALVPRLAAFVKSEEGRLGIESDSAGGDAPAMDDANEADAEKGEACLPIATAVAESDYGTAMPWVQKVFSGEQDSGTDVDGGGNLSISELDVVSLASSGPRGNITDTEGEEEDEVVIDLDALSVGSSPSRAEPLSEEPATSS